MKRLRNIYSKRLSIEDRLKKIAAELSNKAEVADLAHREGWRIIIESLDSMKSGLESEIVDLSNNPTGNAQRIVYLRACIDTIKSFSYIVDSAVQSCKLLNEQANKLETIAEAQAAAGVLAE